MPARERPRVATIPAHAHFARVLARRLIAGAGTQDPLRLARTLVLLPNRRAARTLTEAFVAESGGGGMLLPRMIALSDLEDADAPLGDMLGQTIPPAIPEAERRFRLAGLLAGSRARPANALREAAGLARALDTLTIWERIPSDLEDIDVHGLAEHWAHTLARLAAVSRAWPALLAGRGLIDPAARRVALARLTADRWAADGTAGRPVIAAGIVNPPPFVARLLRVVSRLDGGQVVVPGLDLALDDAVWNALGPDMRAAAAHPQAALKALLDAIGVARAEVEVWDEPGETSARVAAAQRALDPQVSAGGNATPGAALRDIRLIEAATPAEEAQAIALAMRGALEIPGRTAALVTPDRALARRVRAHLARWNIEIDDSAGEPLGQTPPGAFLRLIAECAAERFAPVPLLALLQHPFTGGEGANRLAHLDAVRALDMKLRGPAPATGLDALARRVPEACVPWWDGMAAVLALIDVSGERVLPDHATAWIATATALGGDRAWRGVEGRATAALLEMLGVEGAHLPAMPPAEAAAILAAMLAETPVRAPYGGHPRLAVLGLLEARLQRADLTILGGLNEGVWPATPTPDPWLPPIARAALGLPPAEARIGLAAQDFIAALGADDVLLTRARRAATAPTSPSRFLLRLSVFAGGLTADDALVGRARALDAPRGPPAFAPRPAPAPPSRLRPRSIAVTQVETLRADPFAYYARAMLRLKRLDPVGAELSAAERGQFLHRAMQRWFATGADPAALEAFADAEFRREYRAQPRLIALWRPRLVNAAAWAAAEFARDAAEGWRPYAAEAGGEYALGMGLTLTGRADRIDVGPGGALGIVDYKTGALPDNARLAKGFALQLGLLATMATAGRLEGVGAERVERVRYWRMSGGSSEPGKAKDSVTIKLKDKTETVPWTDIDGFVGECWRWLDEIVDQFLVGNRPFTAKLHPEYATNTDFDQLARVDEWQGRT